MKTLFRGLLIASLILTTFILYAPAQAGSKAPYKIGGIFSITGYLSWLGQYNKQGAELEVELINKVGGVNGHPIELVWYDDKSSPEEAARVAQRLINKDRVVALLGTSTSPNSGAAASVANRFKIPLIVSSGYHVDPAKDPYVFSAVHPTEYAVRQGFEYFKRKGLSKISLLMPMGPLGDLGTKVSIKYAGQYGLKLVGSERFDVKAPDVTPQLAKIRSLHPQAIFSFCTGQPAALLARNMHQLGMTIPIMVSHGNATPGFLKLIKGLSTTILVPSGKIMKPEAIGDGDPSKDIITRYSKIYEQKYNEAPNYFMGMSADSVALIAEGLAKAGSSDPQKLLAGLESIKNFPRMQGVFNMSPKDHYGTKYSDMILLSPKNEKWEIAD